MALLAPQVGAQAGYTESLTGPTPTTGDTYVNSGRDQIVVNNASGGSINVTIKQARTCEYGAVAPAHDKVVAVGAGARRVLGPYDPGLFADADTGRTTFICSATASVTVGIIRPI